MQSNDDFGKLVLRATLAVLVLFHGVSKLINGIDPIMGMVAKAGLPSAFAFLVYIGEVIAPLMILFGIWARLGAVIVAINMIMAVSLAHTWSSSRWPRRAAGRSNCRVSISLRLSRSRCWAQADSGIGGRWGSGTEDHAQADAGRLRPASATLDGAAFAIQEAAKAGEPTNMPTLARTSFICSVFASLTSA